MSDEMPKNADTSGGVRKRRISSRTRMWKALPSFLRGQPRQALEKLGMMRRSRSACWRYGHQTEFAKRYDIKDPTTLTDWNKRFRKKG